MTEEIDDKELIKAVESERKFVGKGLPQILHDRARKSGEELHKLLVSFSTAILAIYFLALTTKTEPPLTNVQMVMSIIGMTAMGLAVLVGMINLQADTKRNYYRACALQASEQQDRDRYFQMRDQWLSRQRWTSTLLRAFFTVGIVATVFYLIARVIEW